MIHPDDEKAIYEEMFASDKAIEDKWKNAKTKVEGLIHPKYFDFMEMNDSYWSDGIIEITVTDEKQSGYGENQRNCRIKNDNTSGLYMHTTGEVEYFYGDEGEYEGESVEYWVNQWSIGDSGDSYSGYLLLPLNDGKYWKVGYSC